MARLDGYTLHLTSPPPQPTIGFTYSAGTLSRSSSAVLSSSKSLKRKRSDESMTVTITVAKSAPAPTAPLILPIVFPSVNSESQNPDGDYPAPPSPAPTEIIDDPNSKTGEECMEEAKAEGVKVRDFAYEPLSKARDPRAPELWYNPREVLALHDRYVRVSNYRAANYRLSGKLLHRLLASNWVTQKEAEANWRPEDWKAVNEYRSRPLGPYPFCIPKSLKKPTAAYRAYMIEDKFVTYPDDIPESQIYVPPDEADMDDGPARVKPELLYAAAAAIARAQSNDLPAPITTIAPSQPAPDTVHADKRRRVSNGSSAGNASATPQSTPPASSTSGATRTPSRDLSSSAPTPPRASTPPAASLPSRPARGRGRGLTRTQTFATIS